MKKKLLGYCVTVTLALVVLPIFITLLYGGQREAYSVSAAQENRNIIKEKESIQVYNEKDVLTVYNPEVEIIEDIGIEEYIKGVVAAEMPALFELEALKAQAVAARTYALKSVQKNENIKQEEIGQAYLNKEQLKQRWGENYNAYWLRISQAVEKTKGEVMLYKDEMIEAVFHSTSSGMTENSENIWFQALPYLKSVESKQDENAPGFIAEKTIKQEDIIRLLQNKYSDIVVTKALIAAQIQIISRSKAGYILQIQVGNKIFTGREIREVLGLKSTDFTVKQKGNEVIFTTKGYGHGVGMSQYGANYMAEAGSKYDEILKHYYQGVEIIKYNE